MRLAARSAEDNAQVFLIVGSALTMYSLFSLVKRAKKNGAVVVRVCYGKTRANHIFDLKLPRCICGTLESVRRVLVPKVEVLDWSSGAVTVQLSHPHRTIQYLYGTDLDTQFNVFLPQ